MTTAATDVKVGERMTTVNGLFTPTAHAKSATGKPESGSLLLIREFLKKKGHTCTSNSKSPTPYQKGYYEKRRSISVQQT